MKGQLRLVFDRLLPELIEPLLALDDIPRDFFGELYAGVVPHLRRPDTTIVQIGDRWQSTGETIEGKLAAARADNGVAEALFADLGPGDFATERDALLAVASFADTFTDLGLEALTAAWVAALPTFVERYSLGYCVDRRGGLHPTFAGLMTGLYEELRRIAAGNPHTRDRLAEFEQAVSDCIEQPAENRVKIALQKEVNLLEALGHANAADLGDTLGAMCQAATSWPHVKIREAASAIAKFSNNYPGLRHGGDPDSQIRRLDERDLTGVGLALVALVPYLSDGICDAAGIARAGEVWSPLTADPGVVALWESA